MSNCVHYMNRNMQLPLLCVGMATCFFSLLNHSEATQGAKERGGARCCVPDQWEALAFLDLGTVFIDQNTAFSYINGTVQLAYSCTKKKVYVNLTGVEQSPLIPHPYPYDTLILYDFQVGTSYQVMNGECNKIELGKNMTRQCVPDDAKLISRGQLSDAGLNVSTYRFTSGADEHFVITATVYEHALSSISPEVCEPVQVTYLTPSVNPDSGTVTRLDMTDIGAVKDESVFDVPKPCQ